MSHLADTNILTRITNVNDPQHTLVSEAVRALLLQGEILYYTQQNRREFWNVCTRPVEVNGLGYTVAETFQRLAEVDATFVRLPDRPEAGPEWDRLVTHYQVTGRTVHDAQLVASMLVNGITHVLTLNVEDFRRYIEVTAVHPAEVEPPLGAPAAQHPQPGEP